MILSLLPMTQVVPSPLQRRRPSGKLGAFNEQIKKEAIGPIFYMDVIKKFDSFIFFCISRLCSASWKLAPLVVKGVADCLRRQVWQGERKAELCDTPTTTAATTKNEIYNNILRQKENRNNISSDVQRAREPRRRAAVLREQVLVPAPQHLLGSLRGSSIIYNI